MQKEFPFIAMAALAVLLGTVEPARILAVVPTISRSHYIWNRVLILALAKRGHQITALSPDPEEEPVPNLRHFHLEGSYERLSEVFDVEGMVHHNAIDRMRTLWTWGIESCGYQTTTKGFKELLNIPQDSFDLILMETVLNECMYMLLHHFGGGTRIPVVGITALGIGPWTDVITGARTMPSVFAIPVLPYLSHMNFWERLHNTMVTGFTWAGMLHYYLPKHQQIADNAYGKPLPPITELGSNISAILVNNHFLISGPQAQLPGIIEVGGLQCGPPKPLPKDIDTFLNESEVGAVFFSLGGNVKSELLPKERLQVLLETFSELGPKIRVIWKFDPKVQLNGLPSNVLIRKWLPQEDVLGHHKVLLFVSHGGLLSTQEAIYHGVPVVGVPFFADQHTNVRRLVEMKVAKHIDFLTMTNETFTDTILSIINEPSYHNNMQKMSQVFRDQPETPLDRAIFWTEFLLRQDEGRVYRLRAAGLDLAWFQFFLLDVFLFTFLGVLLMLLMSLSLIIFIFRLAKKLVNEKLCFKKLKKS